MRKPYHQDPECLVVFQKPDHAEGVLVDVRPAKCDLQGLVKLLEAELGRDTQNTVDIRIFTVDERYLDKVAVCRTWLGKGCLFSDCVGVRQWINGGVPVV